MHPIDRQPLGRDLTGLRTDDLAAARDADDILLRADADQAEADRARDLYGFGRLPALEPDARIQPLLEPGEFVIAMRESALVDRRQPRPGSDTPTGVAGGLYVTSRRLVLVGRIGLSFELDAIQETVPSGDRLLLVLRDGLGVTVEASRPRLLRVQVGAARAALAEERRALGHGFET